MSWNLPIDHEGRLEQRIMIIREQTAKYVHRQTPFTTGRTGHNSEYAKCSVLYDEELPHAPPEGLFATANASSIAGHADNRTLPKQIAEADPHADGPAAGAPIGHRVEQQRAFPALHYTLNILSYTPG